MSSKTISKTEILSVVVGKIRSTSEGFSVYQGSQDDQRPASLTIKQFSGPVGYGQRWCVAGHWHDDVRWGRQFVADFATPGVPRTLHELEDLISGNLVDGWSWRDLARVEEVLGHEHTLPACTKHFEMLADHLGISEMQIASIKQTMARGAGLAPVYSQLGEWGITGRMADRLVKHYGFATTDRLGENPYADLLEIDGYGWKTAESIAAHVGVLADDPRRITAAVELAIHEDTWQAGHTWLSRHEAVCAAQKLAGTAYDAIDQQIASALTAGHIVEEADRYYPAALHKAEQTIATQVAMRLDKPGLYTEDQLERKVLAEGLSEEQCSAVVMALLNPISLMTGGPGVGKTTTLRSLIATARSLGQSPTCMAPTGKAAARMAEATGWPATTIHSRMKIVPGQYSDPDDLEPVSGLVIVDEVSMLDTSLAAQMLRRLSPDAKLLLVGDPDQLPSVGPGAVLRDLIAVDCLARVHLDKVYRNEAGVAVNAKRIRDGQQIISLDDTPIIAADNPAHATKWITELVTSQEHRDRPDSDFLILTPTNDGDSGRFKLNTVLQDLLGTAPAGTGIMQYAGSSTDPDGSIRKRQEEIRRGDRVMVTKNSATLGVFNGQTGRVVSVDVPRSITAEIDGKEIVFSGEDRRLLTLAYAVTGHKAQGSEAPIVIVPVFPSRVLCREWLYTVLTRARERCYLIGDIQAMQACLGVQRASERHTGLVERLHLVLGEHEYGDSDLEAPLACSASQDVCHGRRQAAPWLTLCGLDLRAPGWFTGEDSDRRYCLRCAASSTAHIMQSLG